MFPLVLALVLIQSPFVSKPEIATGSWRPSFPTPPVIPPPPPKPVVDQRQQAGAGPQLSAPVHSEERRPTTRSGRLSRIPRELQRPPETKLYSE